MQGLNGKPLNPPRMTNKQPSGKFYYTSGPKTGNPYFSFKQFTIHQDRCAMKVCTDACLLGAWTANKIIAQGKPVNHILDIGTGTGLLSLMLAQKTAADIDAIELNADAAAQAIENIEASPWTQKINVEKCSILDFKTDKQYEWVISNPPFYEDSLRSKVLAKNEAMHSTTLRLEDLIKSINKHLHPGGTASVMIPFEREEWFMNQSKKEGLFPIENLRVRQTPKHKFFRSLVLLSKNASEVRQDELTIKDESNEYSPGFKSLLQDYYLSV
jgi:tRNA1Val (adenine37-N6)-methyltransferase